MELGPLLERAIPMAIDRAKHRASLLAIGIRERNFGRSSEAAPPLKFFRLWRLVRFFLRVDA